MLFNSKVQFVNAEQREVFHACLSRQANAEPVLDASADLEKIRRFCSFHRLKLRKVCVRRFSGMPAAKDMLLWMGRCLIAGFLNTTTEKGLCPDTKLLSAALIVSDAINWSNSGADQFKSVVTEELERFETDLVYRLRNPELNGAVPSLLAEQGKLTSNFNEWVMMPQGSRNVVIICPSPYSHYSLFLAESYRRLGVNVQAIFIRKFSVDRFIAEFRRDGRRLIRKVWRKLILRGNENPEASIISGRSAVRDINCKYRSVVDFATSNEISIEYVENLNDERVVRKLRSLKPDVVSFTGGGIVSEELISVAGLGVVNVHLGLLPKYRGMDVVQWPLIDLDIENVGACAHLMSREVDAGDIIQQISLNPMGFGSLGSLRNAMSGIVPILHLDSVMRLLSGHLKPTPQPSLEKLHYIMHPRLEALIDRCILNSTAIGGDSNQTLLSTYQNAVKLLNSTDPR